MTSPPPHSKDAINVKDNLRGALTLIGARPESVILGIGYRGQPELTLKLSVMQGEYVARQIATDMVRAEPLVGMLLWSDKQMCVGRVESVSGEMLTLLALSDNRRWRSDIGSLRPALLGEVEAAQRKAEAEQKSV
jgi:hypothetical protein